MAKRALFDSPCVQPETVRPVEKKVLKAEEIDIVPSKGYNLDFLDKLDDPNFNPFETKTAIVENFDNSTRGLLESQSSPIKSKSSLGKRFQKKTIPKTPARPLASSTIKSDIDDSVSIKSEFENKSDIQGTTMDASNCIQKLTKETQDELLEGHADQINQSPQSSLLKKSNGYNLDNPEMYDDPSFNPFETKTKVLEDFVKTECEEESVNVENDCYAGSTLPNDENVKTNDKKGSHHNPSSTIPRNDPPEPVNTLHDERDDLVSRTSPSPRTDVPKDRNEPLVDDLDNTGKLSLTINTELHHTSPQPLQPKPILTLRESEADQLSPTNQFPSPSTSLTPVATPKSVKFSADPPTKFSPEALMETTTEDRMKELLKKINSMKAVESTLSQSDCSFSLPSVIDIPALPASPRHSSPTTKTMLSTVDTQNILMDKGHSFLASQDGDFEISNLASDGNQMKSILVSQGGDLIKASDGESISMMENTCTVSNMTSEHLSQLVLQHEAKLLEKDKQLAAIGQQILERQGEIEKMRWEVATSEESNVQMLGIVGDFETTIGQLINEKERENVACQIEREKAEEERNQILGDLQDVKRAFKDLHKKYERTKEVINALKSNEDNLKAKVTDLSTRFKKGEERYNLLKTHAETKLEEANKKLGEVKNSKAAEIAKLTALLRKAQMGVSSLEKQVDQKNRENKELTTICDELIAKVGN